MTGPGTSDTSHCLPGILFRDIPVSFHLTLTQALPPAGRGILCSSQRPGRHQSPPLGLGLRTKSTLGSQLLFGHSELGSKMQPQLKGDKHANCLPKSHGTDQHALQGHSWPRPNFHKRPLTRLNHDSYTRTMELTKPMKLYPETARERSEM